MPNLARIYGQRGKPDNAGTVKRRFGILVTRGLIKDASKSPRHLAMVVLLYDLGIAMVLNLSMIPKLTVHGNDAFPQL